MDKRIGVRMPLKALFVWNLHSAEDELAPFLKTV
jgi:hypothetical protein